MKRSSFLRATLAVLAWAASATAPLTALAQNYPNRALRIVVPYPPGSSPDALARIVGEHLGRQIGQNVIVENRAGAGGMIGAKAVSEAPTDGATLLMYTPAWSAARVFIKNPPIPVPEGLEPVTMVAEGRFVFMASAALPARDFNEMVAHARANPGKLNFATTGLGDSLLYFHDLAAEKGLKIETVQYKGSAEYVSALFANDVQLAFTPEYSMLPHVRAGKMKPLAITGATRSRAYPDTPTFDELGAPPGPQQLVRALRPAGHAGRDRGPAERRPHCGHPLRGRLEAHPGALLRAHRLERRAVASPHRHRDRRVDTPGPQGGHRAAVSARDRRSRP